MAAFPEGTFSKEGQIPIQLETTQLRWRVQMASPDGQIFLTPLNE